MIKLFPRLAIAPMAALLAAGARALGPMGAVLSVPKLKGLLNDREPFVVFADYPEM